MVLQPLWGVSQAQNLSWAFAEMKKEELGLEKEWQREMQTIPSLQLAKTTLHWQKAGHLRIREDKCHSCMKCVEFWKLNLKNIFCPLNFQLLLLFMYLYIHAFFLKKKYNTLDVLLMQQTQLSLQNKTKIVGSISKINSKDKYYHLKSRNHLSSNLLKWKWESMKIWGFHNSENTYLYLEIFQRP